ncbi:hypothetical protein [Acaryochloris sp. 'Moss Beach']|uniref:hypothetical protein n=1 Tax=Acaryochloris sp. 'Moss Beach' TaxID=2740837 RepID=UPI001F3A9349|nr:hypothetical protein [Acaryochloris sp. 'Moss Beach']
MNELKRLAECQNESRAGFGSLRQGSGQAAQPAVASGDRSLSEVEGNSADA